MTLILNLSGLLLLGLAALAVASLQSGVNETSIGLAVISFGFANLCFALSEILRLIKKATRQPKAPKTKTQMEPVL